MALHVPADRNKTGGTRATPDAWASSIGDRRVLCSEGSGWRTGLVRRWTGGETAISQPPLDHHYVVLHLGGPKRVTRAGAGRTVVTAVEPGALTLVPAGARYDWVTEGPIDFAHLYVHPARFNNVIASRYERDPSAVTLADKVGFSDPVLSAVIEAMLAEVAASASPTPSYLDSLFEVALAHLAHHHSSLGPSAPPARQALAPTRLRRVLELVDRRLAEPLSLADVADAAGLSRFHFSRAFQNAMGEPPMAYVARRRLDLAKRLLRDTSLPLAEIATRCGLGSPSRFSSAFRRGAGRTPSDYRRSP